MAVLSTSDSVGGAVPISLPLSLDVSPATVSVPLKEVLSPVASADVGSVAGRIKSSGGRSISTTSTVTSVTGPPETISPSSGRVMVSSGSVPEVTGSGAVVSGVVETGSPISTVVAGGLWRVHRHHRLTHINGVTVVYSIEGLNDDILTCRARRITDLICHCRHYGIGACW